MVRLFCWAMGWVLVGLSLVFVNCAPAGVCAPGATQICPCLNDQEQQVNGVQSCASDGRSWLACQCPGGQEPPTQETPSVEPPKSTEPPPSDLDAGPPPPDASEPMAPDQSQEPPTEPVLPEGPPEPATPELTPQERVKIDLWPWGAQAAISLSIDDGLKAPFEKLVPEIKRRGWRATLYICTEMATNAGSWADIKQAYLDGHEIGAHTHTHRNMTTLSEAEIRQEFDKAIQELQSRIDWKMPLESFAYPYEASNATVEGIVWDYHRYARGGDQGVAVPPNPVPLNDAKKPNFKFLQAKAPTKAYTVPQWNTWVDAAVKQGKWLIEEYHGVDGKDWEPRTMTEFKAHFDHIETFGAKIWVAPVADVGHYIDERQTTKLTILRWTPQEILLQFQDNFKEKHNVPLTYTIQLPQGWGWTGMKATQGGKVLRTQKLNPSTFRTEALPEPTQAVRLTPVQ